MWLGDINSPVLECLAVKFVSTDTLNIDIIDIQKSYFQRKRIKLVPLFFQESHQGALYPSWF